MEEAPQPGCGASLFVAFCPAIYGRSRAEKRSRGAKKTVPGFPHGGRGHPVFPGAKEDDGGHRLVLRSRSAAFCAAQIDLLPLSRYNGMEM